jgi:predicted ferric reductase
MAENTTTEWGGSDSETPHYFLDQEEINDFFHDLDADNDGYVTIEDLTAKLQQVYDALSPPNLRDSGSNESELEKHGDRTSRSRSNLKVLIEELLPDCGPRRLNREAFTAQVQNWEIPSQKRTDGEKQTNEDLARHQRIPLRRRLWAYWAVNGPWLCFMTIVVALIVGMATWLLIDYLCFKPRVRHALGWGIILAKTCAGALYPTMFFMLLSMSRHFATFLRGQSAQSYWLGKFVNWDLSRGFHVKMSILALTLATLHGIGHLAGTMYYSSQPEHQGALFPALGPYEKPAYVDKVGTLPGITGIASLGCFWTMALLGMPFIRKRWYEVFQLGHLLMFPMIGMLCAHGTDKLIQAPMLGYWLAFPALLVTVERGWRLARGFMGIRGKAVLLDEDTVHLTCRHPKGRDWRYSAGQYVLLQVPGISFFQWHTFTISGCRGDMLQVHIKVSGDWTKKMRDYVAEHGEGEDIKVAVDGPFGAPAQRFYDYDYSIVVGGGIGVTPFAAILNDLEQRCWAFRSLPKHLGLSTSMARLRQSLSSVSLGGHSSRSRMFSGSSSPSRSGSSTPPMPTYDGSLGRHSSGTRLFTAASSSRSRSGSLTPSTTASSFTLADDYRSLSGDTETGSLTPRSSISGKSTPQGKIPTVTRRVDFHWMVRNENNVSWFSDLLNRAIDGAFPLSQHGELELNINTHVTAKQKGISTHVFRYLLNDYRTPEMPCSALTGLKQASNFGRPDLDAILERHFQDLVQAGVRKKKVGVFVSLLSSHHTFLALGESLLTSLVSSSAAHQPSASFWRTNAPRSRRGPEEWVCRSSMTF